jgi:transglutaminase-like putative cysteine protease
VTASATVHIDRVPAGAPTMSWEEIRTDEIADLHTEFLTVTDRVRPEDDLLARAQEIASSSATPSDAAREICALVYQEVKYETGSTSVDAFAAHSWAERNGVCQDMAHIVIGALRAIGIPARYVSGYLHPKQDPEIGEPAAGESHAWVEWWDDGWRGFDPTNDTEPGDRHVIVATGRDYNDVKPLAGIFSGTGTSRMFVDVQVTRLQ